MDDVRLRLRAGAVEETREGTRPKGVRYGMNG